jgi:caffeoyl-CoA O-methyltransferase
MADADSRQGKGYSDAVIREFVNKAHAPHDAHLQAAYDAPAQNDMPSIQLGPAEAKLLALLLRMVGAKKVVEVGTLAGYSALWMARNLPPDGHLWSIELNPKHVDVAQRNLTAAGMKERVTIIEGPALGVLGILEKHGPFDAVFVDADKGSYDQYGRWAAVHLRQGGLLVADNAFYFGELMEDTPEAAAVRRFHLETAKAFDSVCVPTPDGMVVGLRK